MEGKNPVVRMETISVTERLGTGKPVIWISTLDGFTRRRTEVDLGAGRGQDKCNVTFGCRGLEGSVRGGDSRIASGAETGERGVGRDFSLKVFS